MGCVEEIIEKIIKQLKGEEVDKEFWNNFYKYENMSGGPHVTGWIVNFFPYLGGHGELVENKQSEIPCNLKKEIKDGEFS